MRCCACCKPHGQRSSMQRGGHITGCPAMSILLKAGSLPCDTFYRDWYCATPCVKNTDLPLYYVREHGRNQALLFAPLAPATLAVVVLLQLALVEPYAAMTTAVRQFPAFRTVLRRIGRSGAIV